MKMKKLMKKAIVFIIALAVLMMTFPALLIPAAAAPSGIVMGDKTADLSTMDTWRDLFPANSTEQAGSVWTDKSVFTDASAFADLLDAEGNRISVTMNDADNNFLVALSALASNKSIVGYSYMPTDTMLVLDASASMGRSYYVDDLVTAANSAINKLLALNNHNRIGVVLYSGNSNTGNSAGSTATVLLPLDRYSSATGVYLTNSGQSSVSVPRNTVRDGKGNYVTAKSKSVDGGTYIQNGVYMAMEELLEADTVIADGEVQAGTTRTPIFVLMSDGEPTAATNNFAGQNNTANTVGLGTSNIGDGSAISDTVLRTAVDFVNQLTAAYAAKVVDEHYASTTPLFYTLGLGNNASLNSAVLDPDNYTSTDSLWDAYVDTALNSNLLVDIETVRQQGGYPGNQREPDQTAIKKVAEITSVDQKHYVTQYFSASNASGLVSAFDRIVNQIIIQSLYYPTLVQTGVHDHDGFIEFIDEIGHYMEVKDIKGILLGDTLFTGERLAHNFVETGGDLIDQNGNWTELGNNVVWSVMERIGIADAQTARDLITSAYNHKQLYYDTATGQWSNYIGWYADDNGNFMGFWHEGHTEADIPTDAATGVKATYINRSYGMMGEVTGAHHESDLMYISTQVHTRIADNSISFIWRVPASLIPLVSYQVELNGANVNEATGATVEYTPADPIRVLFEVGMNEDINPLNITDKVVDRGEHIRDLNNDGVSDDGKYYFYSNWWDDGNLSHENPSKVHDTIVFFEPSLQNERYYYVEETTVFVKTGSTYTKYLGNRPTPTDGNTYYREYVVFEGDATSAEIVRYYEIMSDATIGVLTDANRNADGSWDVPPGTVHRVLEPYNLEKGDKTLTETLDYVRYPVIDENPADQTFYIGSLLGNNGRLAVDIPQGIKLTKKVDDSLYGTAEIFTFTISGGSLTGDQTAYREDANGNLTKESVTFTGGNATVTLKADESVYLPELPVADYTVTEVINGEYAVKSVTVNGVAQTVGNTVTAPVTRYELTEVAYENRLVVTSGTIVVSKEVVIADPNLTAKADQEFTFEWYNKATPNDKQTFSITADEVEVIANLSGGTYVINEINIPDGYTPRVNNVEVTVASGTVEVHPVHFINDYAPKSVKPVGLTVSGTKTLSGRDWKAGDNFTFRLEMLQGANWHQLAERTVSYNAGGDYNYVFDFANDSDLISLGIELAGTHYFRVEEVVPTATLGGITYDTDYRYFAVEVADAAMDGQLEIVSITAPAPATVTGNGIHYTVDIDFTNHYKATVGDDLVITVDKTMTDLVGANTGRDGFTFGLFAVGGTNPILETAPTDQNGFASLTLTFPASVIPDGETSRTYHFELREIVPDDAVAGMQYVTTPVPVTIVVEDNLDGTVTAYAVDNGTNVPGITVGFENVYDPADATVTLEATKDLDGRDLNPNEFTFELTGDGITGKLEASNKADGLVTFPTLSFDRLGTYHYQIREQMGAVDGVTYDTNTVYQIEIIVTDDTDNDGVLNTEIKVDGNTVTAATMAAAMTITNTYKADDVTVTLEATKKLDGRPLALQDGEFRFDLYEADTNWAKGALLVDNATNLASGTVSLKEITYTTAGDHYYVIVEDEVDGNGITVDKQEYRVYVDVDDNLEGELIATVYVNDTKLTGAIADAIVFTNTYKAAEATLLLTATKTLTGRELVDGEFKFDLLAEDGSVLQDDVTLALQPDGTGLITFASIALIEAKTYRFRVIEDEVDGKGITTHKTPYEVEVVVTDNNAGDLLATVKVDGTEVIGDTAGTIVFANAYAPAENYIELVGNKTLTGRELENEEFSFELYDANGALIETVKNAADGTIAFTPIRVTGTTTVTYTVKEVAGNAKGITYDWTEYTVTVTVTDDKEGNLDIAYAIADQTGETKTAIEFVNLYTPEAPAPSPDTGDDLDMNLWLALLFVSGGCLFTIALFRKKERATDK
ncbi:MAG: hypothetical protein IJE00_02685 [Clostridia bacterium]|nr:hypothetical protein [Clostridia bacterium]